MNDKTVLVTGGSGFIALHCIVQLLDAGYRVRTTVRSPSREKDVREMLRASGKALDNLSFAVADLNADAGWCEAADGCDFILHVASPFPAVMPKNEDELILPAREGALRVLRAAREAGCKRVVLTSSFAAIGYGHPQTDRPFTEENWTNPNARDVTAYVKSKTLAERAAWDFIAKERGALELSVVNPVIVLGPVLGSDFANSIEIIARLMNGSLPGCPRWGLGLVDARDVADLHVRAMTHPDAKGQRFLAIASDYTSMPEIARFLRSHFGATAKRVPKFELPDWLLRIVAVFDKQVAVIVPELGKKKHASSEKARRVLGWSPRSNEETIVATVESLLELGLIPK